MNTSIAFVGLLTVVLSLASCQPARERRPERVVVVTIDTLRADAVGAYGAENAHTKTLDGIAARGVRFEIAVSPVPLTLPAHATLFTGLDPPAHGVRANGLFRLSADIPVMTERFRDAGFATAAFLGAIVLDRQYGLARGFDHYDDQMSARRAADRGGYPERTADAVVDSALDWLDTAPNRFFLWVHLFDPHADYDPPPGFKMSFPRNPYAGEIAFADAQVGRLLAAIAERFPDDGTLVAVTSDHGESLGQHGEPTHSLTIYDATQRIPLVMAGPGVPPGAVVRTPTGLRELGPLLLELCGLDTLPGVERGSLQRLRETEPQSRAVYVETLATQVHFGWSPLFGLHTGDTKYIRAPQPELFDLIVDPHETTNLATRQPERVAELDAQLGRYLAANPARAPRAALELDAETREQLRVLGYALPATPPLDATPTGSLDPKQGLRMLRKVWVALGWMGQGRDAEALELLRDLESAPFVDLTRSRAALGAGVPDAAERYARAAFDASPMDAEIVIALADALEAQHKLAGAFAMFERAHTLDRAHADPLTGLGRISEVRGDPERAFSYYERAAHARGASAEPIWRMAALRIEAGDEAAAERLLASLEPAVRASPDVADRLTRAEERSER